MDFADIKRRAIAAREFSVAAGAFAFTLRLPTQHEIDIEATRARMHDGDIDPAQMTIIRRRLLERAVVGWAGVTWGHLAEGSGADAADFSMEAVSLLLDADPTLAETLDAAFVARLAERNSKRAEAAKN